MTKGRKTGPSPRLRGRRARELLADRRRLEHERGLQTLGAAVAALQPGTAPMPGAEQEVHGAIEAVVANVRDEVAWQPALAGWEVVATVYPSGADPLSPPARLELHVLAPSFTKRADLGR